MFQARERHNFLNRFPHCWPVEEFLKSYLKNKRAYARKRGYLTENTNQKQGWRQHDDDDDNNEEEEEEEDGEEKNEEEEEEGGGYEWSRGNGWSYNNTGEDDIQV